MKKLTIFRTGKYEAISGKLLQKSAFEMFALAKEVRREYGSTSMIMSSHIPEAINSAKIIQHVMDGVKIVEQPRLSRYHAGRELAFIEDFLRYTYYYYAHISHIILVSHSMNIAKLTNMYVKQGFSVTLGGADWKDIFVPKPDFVSAQADRLIQNGCMIDAVSDNLSAKEKAFIASLSYVTH